MRYYRIKTTTNILALIIMTIILGCGQTATQDKKSNTQVDSIKSIDTKKKLTKEKRQKQIEEKNRTDSLRLDMALKDAFKIAQAEFKRTNLPNNMNFNLMIVYI